MGTHCNVKVKLREDLYKTIYVHYDGYPSYMLDILEDNYNTQELAEALVSHGDASFIGVNLNESVFYHRDRGEDLDAVDGVLTEDSSEGWTESYRYLWADGRWSVV